MSYVWDHTQGTADGRSGVGGRGSVEGAERIGTLEMAVAASPRADVAFGTSPTPTSSRLARAVVAAPDLVTVALAGASIGPMALLLVGHFSPPAAITVAVLGAVLAVVVCGARPEAAGRREVVITLVALAVVAGWTTLTAVYSGENLYAQRDPAIYNLTARWLMDHHALGIPTHPEIFGSPVNADQTSAGFLQDRPGVLYAQGNHLLPVAMAGVGWLLGIGAMLKTNAVIGGVALLAFFGLARRVTGGPLALVAMCAVAVSMPMLYVSRDAFSEPFAMALLLGGGSLLYRAMRSDRVADYALAGLVSGSAALVRIDSLVALLPLIVTGTALLVVAPPGGMAGAGRRVGALLSTSAVATLLGYLDVSHLSSGYYHNQRHQIVPLITAAGALACCGAAAVVAARQRGVRSVLQRPATRVVLARASVAALVLAAAVLVTRPWWMTVHGPADNELVRNIQRAAGRAVDGTRLYDEQAVNWQAMYLGWPTLGLALVGYGVLLWRLIRDGERALLGVLTLTLSASALYLWTPQITPDQIWAMRRFVPVVIPGLALAAVVALGAMRSRLAASDRRALARSARVVVVLGAAVVVGVPAAVSRPVLGLREEVPQLAQVRTICGAVGPSAALIEADDGLRYGYSQTLRAFCGVPSIGMVGATPRQLADARAAVAAHGRTLYVLAADPKELTYAGDPPRAPFAVTVMSRWPSTLNVAPRAGVRHVVQVFLATVRPDGSVDPVQPSR